MTRLRHVACAAVTVLLTHVSAASELTDANAFLDTISTAVNSTNYRGVLIRTTGGQSNAMRILHSNDDGFIREKLVAMDGEGREIIRTGNELICLLPSRRIKIVDTNAVPSNAFSRLQAATEALGDYYTLQSLGKDRVAGRTALRYYIQPSDQFRYGHHFWIDAETSMPLRMQLVNGRRVIEEIRFVDIAVGVEISEAEFESDTDSRDFKVMQAMSPRPGAVTDESPRARVTNISGRNSLGFRLDKEQMQLVEINGRKTQRLVFSDGLVTVSAFIEQRPDTDRVRRSQVASMGAAHSYQAVGSGLSVTVVGEVPAETLRIIAEKAEQQWLSAMDTEGGSD
ncbi:MAG: MucB/RseB C-terminal domain-containing protein [Pseudomonadota bacterium]